MRKNIKICLFFSIFVLISSSVLAFGSISELLKPLPECATEEDFCGGFTGIECCSKLTCKSYGTNPNAGGYCVKKQVSNGVCFDSDGLNPDVKGYVKGTDSYETSYILFDECDGSKVNEKYCYESEKGNFVSGVKAYGCENGCSDGACVEVKSANSTETYCGGGTYENCYCNDDEEKTCISSRSTIKPIRAWCECKKNERKLVEVNIKPERINVRQGEIANFTVTIHDLRLRNTNVLPETPVSYKIFVNGLFFYSYKGLPEQVNLLAGGKAQYVLTIPTEIMNLDSSGKTITAAAVTDILQSEIVEFSITAQSDESSDSAKATLEIAKLNEYCNGGSYDKDCYCNKDEEKVCSAYELNSETNPSRSYCTCEKKESKLINVNINPEKIRVNQGEKAIYEVTIQDIRPIIITTGTDIRPETGVTYSISVEGLNYPYEGLPQSVILYAGEKANYKLTISTALAVLSAGSEPSITTSPSNSGTAVTTRAVQTASRKIAKNDDGQPESSELVEFRITAKSEESSDTAIATLEIASSKREYCNGGSYNNDCYCNDDEEKICSTYEIKGTSKSDIYQGKTYCKCVKKIEKKDVQVNIKPATINIDRGNQATYEVTVHDLRANNFRSSSRLDILPQDTVSYFLTVDGMSYAYEGLPKAAVLSPGGKEEYKLTITTGNIMASTSSSTVSSDTVPTAEPLDGRASTVSSGVFVPVTEPDIRTTIKMPSTDILEVVEFTVTAKSDSTSDTAKATLTIGESEDEYCNGGSENQDCYCNDDEQKICTSTDIAPQLPSSIMPPPISSCQCVKETKTGIPFDVKISKGWNLLSPAIFGIEHIGEVQQTDCESDFKLFSFFPLENKYGRYKLVQKSNPEEKKTLISILTGNAVTGSERWDELSIIGLTPEDDELLKKYQNTKTGYLISTIANSWWASSSKPCSIKGTLGLEFKEPGVVSMVNEAGAKLPRGWNFLTISPDVVGYTIDDFKGDCEIKKAYMFDKKWVDVRQKKIDERMIGQGMIVQTRSECLLGFESEVPPLPLIETGGSR